MGAVLGHHHDEEDELFLVVKGRFRMEFRNRHTTNRPAIVRRR
ncbi:MAG: hypothetical protein Q7J79_06625 [Gemmatimonadales bacterium]|nr:hypothetical protein [Gemmatimonadales bacterium]